MTASRYANDLRVVLRDDGTACIPDPDRDAPPAGDWIVEHNPKGPGFVVRNVGDQGHVYDDTAWFASRTKVPRVFATLDDAIAHVIGEPS